jgi:hypothetical protein
MEIRARIEGAVIAFAANTRMPCIEPASISSLSSALRNFLFPLRKSTAMMEL